MDVPLLEHISSTRPGWSIVLIGRQNYSVEAERQRFLSLVARPNVHWLGHRPHHTLPAYLKGLDVCMMCYVINNWTYYGDPLKMHEYLASGKPTIAVGLKSIQPFADVVAIREKHEDWVVAIEEGLHRDTDEARAKRIETARQNSSSRRIAASHTNHSRGPDPAGMTTDVTITRAPQRGKPHILLSIRTLTGAWS